MVFKRKKIVTPIFIGMIFIIGFLSVAHAQSVSLTGANAVPDDLSNTGANYATGPTADDILITSNPENPSAFQDVILRTTSDYIDLNRYATTWFVDGKKIAEGIGQRTATVHTQAYGQKLSVVILVQLPDTLIKKEISFEPQDMTLIWEAADSYVPPFYEGKKLVPREGIIKVVAIPNFKAGSGLSFDPKTGVYKWTRNNNIVGDATGYGKDSFSFKNNKIRASESVSVDASDTVGTSEAIQTISVATYNPKILFYQKNPRTGILNPFAKNSLDFNGNTTSIVAEPYFFSTNLNNPNPLAFNWTMNGSPITLADQTNKKTLTLQNPGGSGTAVLGLAITNPNSLFQSALSQLTIAFNKN
jgi:hypothetical protein